MIEKLKFPKKLIVNIGSSRKRVWIRADKNWLGKTDEKWTKNGRKMDEKWTNCV